MWEIRPLRASMTSIAASPAALPHASRRTSGETRPRTPPERRRPANHGHEHAHRLHEPHVRLRPGYPLERAWAHEGPDAAHGEVGALRECQRTAIETYARYRRHGCAAGPGRFCRIRMCVSSSRLTSWRRAHGRAGSLRHVNDQSATVHATRQSPRATSCPSVSSGRPSLEGRGEPTGRVEAWERKE